MPLSDDDYRDIQGLVRFGYEHLAGGTLSFVDHHGCRGRACLAVERAGDDSRERPPAGRRPARRVHLRRAATTRRCTGHARRSFRTNSSPAWPRRAVRAGSATSRQTIRNGGSGAAPASCRTSWCCSMPSRQDRLDEWERELKDRSWEGRVFDADVACRRTTSATSSRSASTMGSASPCSTGSGRSRRTDSRHDRLHQPVGAWRSAARLSQRVRKVHRPSAPRSS